MITVSAEQFFIIALIAFVLLVAALWIYALWSTSANKLNVSEERLLRCKSCSLIYIAQRSESVRRCPRCETLNQVNSKSKV